MIVIDQREPKLLIEATQHVGEKLGIPTSVDLLDTGDFLLMPNNAAIVVGIERKTVSDMVGSLSSGRLRKQLTALRSVCTTSYLLVEGPLDFTQQDGKLLLKMGGRTSGWNFAAIHNFLSGLHMSGTGWGHTSSQLETVLWLTSLYKLLSKERVLEPQLVYHKQADELTQQERVLCAIDGVGPKAAKLLLTKYGSISSLCKLLAADGIIPVQGVGPITKDKLRKALVGE
jgi:ERCC4-type nuclease